MLLLLLLTKEVRKYIGWLLLSLTKDILLWLSKYVRVWLLLLVVLLLLAKWIREE